MAKKPKSHPCLLRRADIAAAEQGPHCHPWNPNSELHGVQLARALGLKRAMVAIARMPAGKESFIYHAHRHEEEWLYILSGQGIAEIDGADYPVQAGDFMAFPAPSLAHHLRNLGPEDLVYLMGGEYRDLEVATFPNLGKIMVRDGDEILIFNEADKQPFGPPKPKSRKPKS
jgi:uncharacterized cupin superfamily protein